MKKNKVLSPCINICQTDPVNGYCRGCGRTRIEIASWGNKKTSDEWKRRNLKEAENRLVGVQRSLFAKAYKEKHERLYSQSLKK
jgi:hypothetical protein|tara:strand:+ start:85 stop:336 length:252 start_codon:yes stop_codon:yes gene_type:complete